MAIRQINYHTFSKIFTGTNNIIKITKKDTLSGEIK